MAKQEFLQLAHKLDLNKVGIAGRFVSEKLDGQRFMWDGGASRGLLAKDVPYANTTKDARYLEDQPATGLWSRYGKAIQAPDWWLDGMPTFPVEGELWTGHGQFQRVSSIVRSSVNISDEWQDVIAMVFDAPPPITLFAPRIVKNPTADFEIKAQAYEWWRIRTLVPRLTLPNTPFHKRYRYLEINLRSDLFNLSLVPQIRLPMQTQEAIDELNRATDTLLEMGAEGTMVKSPNDLWLPQRVRSLLKYKPFYDAEDEVVGWTWGRETDKGSKLLGKMGAMILKSGLKLSGFTDEEREMVQHQPISIHFMAGKQVEPGTASSVHFPIGSTVAFKYRELSDDGVPKEARYWRKP